MTPTPRPGRVASEMGRRILDLMDHGWTMGKIARHCRCDKSGISRLLDDPRMDPSYITGELLIELHEMVMTGESKWERLIRELVLVHKLTYRDIARRCGVSVSYLRWGVSRDPKRVPRHRLGSALMKLYNEQKEGQWQQQTTSGSSGSSGA